MNDIERSIIQGSTSFDIDFREVEKYTLYRNVVKDEFKVGLECEYCTILETVGGYDLHWNSITLNKEEVKLVLDGWEVEASLKRYRIRIT